MDLERLNRKISSVEILTREMADPDLMIPHSLLGAGQNERMVLFRELSANALQYMPITCNLINEICTDFYSIRSKSSYWYIFEFILDGEFFFYRSGIPRRNREILGKIDLFYKIFDGFCDLNMQGGLLPLQSTKLLGLDGYTYNEEPTASISSSLIGKSLHVFNSGGKGQGYLDLQSVSLHRPVGHVLWLDDDRPLIGVDFWNLVDSWTEIAIQ